MTIPSALTRQLELQLALKSPMAVATSLTQKKLPYLKKHMKKACTRLVFSNLELASLTGGSHGY